MNLKYSDWTYREYIKTAKNGSFCEKLLGEIDFKAVLANFCCYGYGANASEAVQKIRTKDTGVLRQLTKTANFVATPMKKHLAVYPQEHLVVMRDEKVSPFVKFEIIQPLLCFL